MTFQFYLSLVRIDWEYWIWHHDTNQSRPETNFDKIIYFSWKQKLIACSRLHVMADISFVMKAGLSRLSTDDAWFLVDLEF